MTDTPEIPARFRRIVDWNSAEAASPKPRTAIHCERRGGPYERFPGRGKGYDIYAVDTRGLVDAAIVGHAVKVTDNWGRPYGWVVLDYDGGEVLLGAGEATTIGKGLSDCCFMFARKMEGW